ncbi:MAG: subtilase-type protease inhibitor [Nocardiopsaceae bacterium]|nr:subtilase-type protease inhibitor [Nocardiopsaceae bacterium]
MRIFCTRGGRRRDERLPGRFVLAAVIACALAVAGCSASTSSPNTNGGGGGGGGGNTAKVTLKFQMKNQTANTGKPETLTCDPTGGTESGAASACSALLNLKKKNPFAPVAKGIACPMLLRSNKKILVTGTWFGVTVHRLVVDGGCDIDLFDSLNKILN